MMSILDASILGLVEGLTEFLPVSSTGHLILTGEFLGLSGDFSETFEVVIQVGAMLAVVACYFSRFWHLLFPKKNEDNASNFSGLRGILLLILTTFPGAFLGFLLHSSIKSLFSAQSVALALLVGGILMLFAQKFQTKPKYNSLDEINPLTALGIGCFQCLALWPGFSRSASTIVGGMLLGLKKEVAAEYSFIAAVPIIFGAAFFDLYKSYQFLGQEHILPLFVGTLVAFVSAFIAIKSFIALLSKVGLAPFAYYRIALAVIVFIVLL